MKKPYRKGILKESQYSIENIRITADTLIAETGRWHMSHEKLVEFLRCWTQERTRLVLEKGTYLKSYLEGGVEVWFDKHGNDFNNKWAEENLENIELCA